MKTRAWIFVLLLGMLAMGACCFWWPVAETKVPAPVAKGKPATASAKPKAPPIDAARAKEHQEKMALLELHSAEIKDRQKELMARMAKSVEKITPEMQQKMVEGYMHSHEPQYRDLFASWSLDSDTQQRVLDIIRERETQQTANRLELFKSGFTPENKKSLAGADATAEGQLLFLLGPDHLDQISLVDKQMQEQALAAVRQKGR